MMLSDVTEECVRLMLADIREECVRLMLSDVTEECVRLMLSDVTDEELKKLSGEVLDLMKATVGVETFTREYASTHKDMTTRREGRKRQRAQEVSAIKGLTTLLMGADDERPGVRGFC